MNVPINSMIKPHTFAFLFQIKF